MLKRVDGVFRLSNPGSLTDKHWLETSIASRWGSQVSANGRAEIHRAYDEGMVERVQVAPKRRGMSAALDSRLRDGPSSFWCWACCIPAL